MLNDIGLQGSYPFLNKNIQGLSRAQFLLFKDSIQYKKEPWVYVFLPQHE